MATDQQQLREAFWKNHLSSWKKSSLGMKAYCQENGINQNTFYYWRAKLNASLPAIRKATLPVPSSFIPVEISTKNNAFVSGRDLPDPKWLGEFAAALIGGLR